MSSGFMEVRDCVAASSVLTKADELTFLLVDERCAASSKKLCFASLGEMAEQGAVSLTTLKRSLPKLVRLGVLIKHKGGVRPSYSIPERLSLATIYALQPLAKLAYSVIRQLKTKFPMNEWLAGRVKWMDDRLEKLKKKAAKKKRAVKPATEPAADSPLHPPAGTKAGTAIERVILERAEPAPDDTTMVRRKRTQSIGDALTSDAQLAKQRATAARRRKRLGNLAPSAPSEDPPAQQYIAGSIDKGVDQWSATRLLHYTMHRAHIHQVDMWSNSRGQHSFEKPLRIQPKYVAQFSRLLTVLEANGYVTRYDQAKMFDAWFEHWVSFLAQLPKARCNHFNPTYWLKAWNQAGKVIENLYAPASQEEMAQRAKELPTSIDHEGIMGTALPAELEQAAQRARKAEETGQFDYTYLDTLLRRVAPGWFEENQLTDQHLTDIATRCQLAAQDTDHQLLHKITIHSSYAMLKGVHQSDTYELLQAIKQHIR